MELSGAEVAEAHLIETALALIHKHGGQARALAEEQLSNSLHDEAVAARWREIAGAVTALVHANLHMELALDLLDGIGEVSVPPYLDHAIVRLGIRRTAGDQSTVSGSSGLEVEQESLQHRARWHLDMAAASSDRDAKALYLDQASRFAALREAKARNLSE